MDANGDMVLDSDGGSIRLTANGGAQTREILNSPRHFGAVIATPRSNTAPSISSKFSDGGVQITSVVRDNNAITCHGAGPASSEFASGLAISFSANGGPLAKPPICTLQPTSDIRRPYEAVIYSVSTTSIRVGVVLPEVAILGSTPTLVRSCETGSALVISCHTSD